MRLGAVDAGAGELRRRLGREPSGVLLTLYHRPELFGRPFSDALDLAMRGPSDWSAGETRADAEAVRAQGVSDEALIDAVHVAACST